MHEETEYHNWDEEEHPLTPIVTWFTKIQLTIYFLMIIYSIFKHFNLIQL